jgi:AAA+ ATPase superfamily predicted ATPase
MKTEFKKPENPFIMSGYTSSELFCDRENETKRVLNSIKNGRNLTLVSIRRMGKTGLIRHAFNPEINQNKYQCYYVDLFSTQNLSDFTLTFANAVLGTIDTTSKRLLKSVFAFFRAIRPTLVWDPFTGEPKLSIEFDGTSNSKVGLDEIFNYLNTSKKPVVVAFDEFQQIAQYPENNIEAILRTYAQKYNNIRFIFSGSKKHVLQAMFQSPSRPFYMSTEMMYLEPIPKKPYVEFAKQIFKKHKKRVESGLVEFIYDQFEGHTWYVQYSLNQLFERSPRVYTMPTLERVFEIIVWNNNPIYQSYRDLLTTLQFDILKAVAKEGKVKSPTSADFISKHKLGATSSVAQAVKTLVEKDMLQFENSIYSVSDRFLAMWLTRVYAR